MTSSPMTDERLAEIQARVDASTPGGWEVIGEPRTEIGAMMDTPDCIVVADTKFFAGEPTPRQLADARLIAHTRQDVPDLLAALAESRAEAAELRSERDDWHAAYGDLVSVRSSLGDEALALAQQIGEERDDTRDQLADLRRALRRTVSFMEDAPELWGNPAADSAIAQIRAAASTSETKPARVGDQPDENQTNRPPQRETETSTAASGAQTEEEGT